MLSTLQTSKKNINKKINAAISCIAPHCQQAFGPDHGGSGEGRSIAGRTCITEVLTGIVTIWPALPEYRKYPAAYQLC